MPPEGQRTSQKVNAMPIRIKIKGKWDETEKFLKRCKKPEKILAILEKYGRMGVEALSSATPVDTGKTASSWEYKIVKYKTVDATAIVFTNSSKTESGIPIVVLLQYGHGNGRGGYVQGRDFINPAIQPIFDKIAKRAWEEVTR